MHQTVEKYKKIVNNGQRLPIYQMIFLPTYDPCNEE